MGEDYKPNLKPIEFSQEQSRKQPFKRVFIISKLCLKNKGKVPIYSVHRNHMKSLTTRDECFIFMVMNANECFVFSSIFKWMNVQGISDEFGLNLGLIYI